MNLSTAERYAVALRLAREVAREHGYALAVHGSQSRDLDLVAVPWVDAATPPGPLVEAIRLAVGGFILKPHPDADPNDWSRRNPQSKPHGRLAWSIHLGGGPYLDLSVMPRKRKRA